MHDMDEQLPSTKRGQTMNRRLEYLQATLRGIGRQAMMVLKETWNLAKLSSDVAIESMRLWVSHWQLRRAYSLLGKEMVAQNVGDERLRQEIALVDQRATSALQNSNPLIRYGLFRWFELHRRHLAIRLARHSLRAEPCWEMMPSAGQVRMLVDALKTQRCRLDSCKATIQASSTQTWLRTACGLGLMTIVAITIVSVAFERSSQASRERESSESAERKLERNQQTALDMTNGDPDARTVGKRNAEPRKTLPRDWAFYTADTNLDSDSSLVVGDRSITSTDTAQSPVPKKPVPLVKKEKVELPRVDIRQSLSTAGFDGKTELSRDLKPYVQFGSKLMADKFRQGDTFDQIEVNKATKEHRDGLRQKRFLMDGLKFRPMVKGDIETKGLMAELILPMRVRGKLPFFEDVLSFAGVLSWMHPSEVNQQRYAFLTKSGTIQPCTWNEAMAVQRNNGVLYYPEVGYTTLMLVFDDTLDALKVIAREANDYTVKIEFSELRYERPISWGYFNSRSYFANDQDCQKVWCDFLLDVNNPQPVYFATGIGSEDKMKIPEIVWANLDSLQVSDKNGNVIGSYRPVLGQ